MGTTKILEAYQENEEKFKTITKLSQNIQEAVKKKREILSDIVEVYRVVFKNFSTEKVRVPYKIKIRDGESETDYDLFVNRDGFSIRYSSSGYRSSDDDYTNGIDTLKFEEFIFALKEIKHNLLGVAQYIKGMKRTNKQQILVDFLKDIEIIKFINEFEKKLDKSIPLKTINVIKDEYDEIRITEFKVDPTRFSFDYNGVWNWNNHRVGINIIGLSDKLIIEQVYEELKQVLEEYLAEETKNLNNARLFLEKKKERFSGELVMDRLKRDNKKIK